jgi:hypothetical protein
MGLLVLLAIAAGFLIINKEEAKTETKTETVNDIVDKPKRKRRKKKDGVSKNDAGSSGSVSRSGPSADDSKSDGTGVEDVSCSEGADSEAS